MYAIEEWSMHTGCIVKLHLKSPKCAEKQLHVPQAFRGFAGTSILILVGVASDTARKFKAEQAMQRYGDVDRLYDDVQL